MESSETMQFLTVNFELWDRARWVGGRVAVWRGWSGGLPPRHTNTESTEAEHTVARKNHYRDPASNAGLCTAGTPDPQAPGRKDAEERMTPRVGRTPDCFAKMQSDRGRQPRKRWCPAGPKTGICYTAVSICFHQFLCKPHTLDRKLSNDQIIANNLSHGGEGRCSPLHQGNISGQVTNRWDLVR